MTVSIQKEENHVTFVTIERPASRNAIDGATATALDAAVTETENDDDVWTVILSGSGRNAFSSGADLKEIADGKYEKLYTPNGGFAGFVDAQRSKVWIAAVEGAAVAGGFEIALACDLIVAADDARFALPEVKRGLVAAAGGAYRLPRLLPRNLANELIATGAFLSAKRAFDAGLVNRLSSPGGAVDIATKLAEQINLNAPLAVRESLTLARRTFDDEDAGLRKASMAAQVRIMETDDFHEGPRAFIEKRQPQWRGTR